MAYFSNGEAGYVYQAKYCERCVNYRYDEDSDSWGCPITDLHYLWNYDAVGDNADVTKQAALNHFIPEEPVTFDDGSTFDFPAECRMFLEIINDRED